MTLAINETAPDFEAQTTEGKIRFHDWIGNSRGRAVLTPKGFHAGMHHGTWLHGQDQV
jgi:thioredoxin-dependent peroxiredoxin